MTIETTIPERDRCRPSQRLPRPPWRTAHVPRPTARTPPAGGRARRRASWKAYRIPLPVSAVITAGHPIVGEAALLVVDGLDERRHVVDSAGPLDDLGEARRCPRGGSRRARPAPCPTGHRPTSGRTHRPDRGDRRVAAGRGGARRTVLLPPARRTTALRRGCRPRHRRSGRRDRTRSFARSRTRSAHTTRPRRSSSGAAEQPDRQPGASQVAGFVEGQHAALTAARRPRRGGSTCSWDRRTRSDPGCRGCASCRR